jgi:hypothetical protein
VSPPRTIAATSDSARSTIASMRHLRARGAREWWQMHHADELERMAIAHRSPFSREQGELAVEVNGTTN